MDGPTYQVSMAWDWNVFLTVVGKRLSARDPRGARGVLFQSNFLPLSDSYADFFGSTLEVRRMLRVISI